MRTTLIVATRGRPQMLREMLASLRAGAAQPDEIIVVDGDPALSAQAVVGELAAANGSGAVRYLHGVSGLTRQRNLGIDHATGDVVVFCDDDIDLRPDAWGRLVAAFAQPGVVGATGYVIERSSQRIGSTQSALRRRLPRHPRQGSMGHGGFPRRVVDDDRSRDIEMLNGCFMAARRPLAAAVRFDEDLPGYGLAEDEDFGYRLSRHGRVRFVHDAVVVHRNTGMRSIDQRAFNRMLVENRAYLMRKNLAPGVVAWIRFGAMIGVLAVHRALNREWRGVIGLAEGCRQLLERS